MDRRHFITLVGGGVVMAAGLEGCAEVPDATVAWVSPGSSERDVRRYALAHAILAPNPHNRQPWLARLEGEDAVTLFIDRSRLLPATDPFSRQIVIGCGAFLELLAIAAGAKGHTATVTAFPDGQPADRLDERPFARVVFTRGGALDPLFRNILRRRTTREPYDTARAIPAADLAAVGAAVGPGLRTGAAAGGQALAALKTLARDAYRREVDTPAANQETIDLMRIGDRQIAAHRDGLFLRGPGIEAMRVVGILTPENLARPGTIAFKQARAFADPLCEATAAFLWIVSPGNDRAVQIASGRAYARMALEATARGIAIQPMSQALQEYPQMAPFFARMDRLTAVGPGERLQMLVRAGYAADVPPAPRKGLQDLFRSA
ncbi:MAG: twin-arginine translocation pathway signal protein [Caulobacteraceae bacterium]|nr:MAG: twin-arginine translocation pathway signal protein [Caulobacteraceae bacterium]